MTDPEGTRPRDVQQLLVFYGITPSVAQPLRKHSLRTVDGGRERLRWLEQQRAARGPERDDPAVCPPAVPGQLALFPARRSLPLKIVPRILNRPLRGYEDVVPITAAYAAENGYSKPWLRQLQQMVRLILAVRDAEGCALVPGDAIDDLQYYQVAVDECLRRAGMLGPRRDPGRPRMSVRRRPAVEARPPRPRRETPAKSCADCEAWTTGVHGARCPACRAWRATPALHPVGTCGRCRRTDLPVNADQRCRGCLVALAVWGPDAGARPVTQLWLGATRPPKAPSAADHSEEALTAHPLLAGQLTLFPTRRDWSALVLRPTRELPPLGESAQAVMDELADVMRAQHWSENTRRAAAATMRVLLCWLGADEAIPEQDVYDLVKCDSHLKAKRVVQFLEPRGLLAPDPERRADRDERLIEELLGKLPGPIAEEVRVWVQVLRGEGSREHPPRAFLGIRRYLDAIHPTLMDWAGTVTSLREITTDGVTAAIATRKGNPARMIHVVLRSLFRALRQERVIFRDPTRGLVFPGIKILPPSVPSDQLGGLLDGARTAVERFFIALVAVHALPGTTIRGLQLSWLDLSAGTLTTGAGLLPHVVLLEDFTHQLAADWLTERHRRWPAAINPHLFISQQSALDTTCRPVSATMFRKVFSRVGLTMEQVRQDRILFEARQHADPLHLMRLFGLSDGPAMRYVTAAHPERTMKLPR
ncbi:hypothetical protein [Streptomyces noursei]|uniref:hypothetical protein n=1 Tax=Streptomyces noursei TaxID=1971 RepID=UPI003805C862